MLIGETRLNNKGENGYVESTYKITFKNGVEIGRELINQNRKEPINEVKLEGNLEQYTQEVDVFDENYQMIKTEYVEKILQSHMVKRRY